MYESAFLIILALIWLVIASIQDIKKREIPNWLSFSLIIFALGYRAFYSIFNSDYLFFIYGLFGFGIFFVLAYVFYYARIFAGGDAKLLMALGIILPLASSFFSNLVILGFFIILLMLTGSIYGLLYSLILISLNKNRFVKEFKKQFLLRRSMVILAFIFSILSLVFGFFIEDILFLLPLVIFIFPFVFIYAKSVEESCMVKQVSGNKVTVGDWLYEEIKVKGKKIKPYWEGLSEKEVEMLRKYRKRIKIKQGIAFAPVFLISFILFLLIGFRVS